MHVLITGGAGYVGYSLVRQLLTATGPLDSIAIYDNLSRRNYSFFTEARFDHKPLRFIHGDILDARLLGESLKGIDCVVHLAARVTTPFADSEAHAYDQVNHWGTAQLAYAIEQSDVRRVVYLSSLAVYGEQPGPVDESTLPNPRSFYGRSKWDGEQQLRVLARSRDLFILRSGNVYGYNPAYRIDAVINRFMFNAHFTGKIMVNGSGEQHRSFIHVDKLAAAIEAAAQDRLDPGTYNVAEHNLTINAIAGEVSALYPGLDVIHAHHNLRMKDLTAALPCRIWESVPLPATGLPEELAAFKAQFSF
jgi:UDP-glucose 4-epimerase